MTTRKKYSKESKIDAISLVLKQGYSRVEAARSLNLNTNMLGHWIKEQQQYSDQASRGNGKLTPEQTQQPPARSWWISLADCKSGYASIERCASIWFNFKIIIWPGLKMTIQIVLDYFFRHLANCAKKIPFRLKMATPVSFLDMRKLFEQLARSSPFHSPHYLTWG